MVAQCVKQSSLPSRVNKRSETATKIFSEDRARAGRLSTVKMACYALDPDHCIARAVEFPDWERRFIRR
jgi:hypothetical protein